MHSGYNVMKVTDQSSCKSIGGGVYPEKSGFNFSLEKRDPAFMPKVVGGCMRHKSALQEKIKPLFTSQSPTHQKKNHLWTPWSSWIVSCDSKDDNNDKAILRGRGVVDENPRREPKARTQDENPR